MCQFGEHNICASAFSSRAFGDPERSWERSAHGFCSDFHLPLQAAEPHVHPHRGHAHRAALACGCTRVYEWWGNGRKTQHSLMCQGEHRAGLCSPTAAGLLLLPHLAHCVQLGSGAARSQRLLGKWWDSGAAGRGDKRNQTCESQPDCTRHNRSAVSEAVSCCSGGQPCSHLLFSSFNQSNREQLLLFPQRSYCCYMWGLTKGGSARQGQLS